MFRIIIAISLILLGGFIGDCRAMSKEHVIAIKRSAAVDPAFNANELTLPINQLTLEQRQWADNNELTVYISQSWFPYSFKSPTGDMIGYHIDLLGLIEQNLNIKLRKLVYNDWLQALDDVKTAKVGSIMGASPTEKRAQYFTFSPIYLYRSAELFTAINNTHITSRSELARGIIAVMKGDVLEHYLIEQFPLAKLLLVANEVELNEAVLTGRADAGVIVAESGSSQFYGQFKTLEQFSTKSGEFAVASSHANTMNASIMAMGVESLSAPQRQRLFDKWLASPTKYSLYNEPELVFLRKHPTLSVGAALWSDIIENPTERFMASNETVINAMSNMMGIHFTMIHDTKENVLAAVENGHLDIAIGVRSDEAKNKRGLLSQVYESLKVSAYSKSKYSFNTTRDLTGKKIAVNRYLHTHLANPLNDIGAQLSIVDSDDIGFELLLNNEVDGMLSSRQFITEHLKTIVSTLNHSALNGELTIDLRFFSANKHAALQSILQKTLTYIQRPQSRHMIDNDQSINLVAQREPMPFIAEKDIVKGIAYDLLESTFSAINLKLNTFSIASANDVRTIFENNDDLDVMAMVEKKDDGYFYSDELTTYLDVVVSRLDNNFHFESLADLSGKSIVAWEGAYNALGDEYKRLFSLENRLDNYQEISDQYRQLEMLIANKVDVIITDATILAWYVNQINPSVASDLRVDYIIPKTIPRYVAFKDESLRDLFNHQLKVLKDSGHYQSIISRYTHGAIRSQVKLSQLVSNLISKSSYENDHATKTKLLNTLSNLDFIDEINISIPPHKPVRYGQHTAYSQQHSTRILYVKDGKIIDIGELNIWYDPKKLSHAVSLGQDIPQLSKFKHMKDYIYFQSVYRRLGYAKQKLKFTAQEASYLASYPEVKYTDTNWQPLIFNEQGVNKGIVVDYLHLISRKTGLRFKYVPATSWAMAKQSFVQNEVDILPSIGDEENTIGLHSREYAKFHFAIVKRQDGSFADNLQDLENDRVVVLKGFTPALLIKNQFPQIKLTEALDVNEALTLLSQGTADAFVGHAAVAWHYIVNDFSHLKVVGMTEDSYRHHVLVQQDNPVLLSIMNKAINDMEYDETAIIRNHWVDKKQSLKADYTLIIRVVVVFSFMLMLGYFFTRKLLMKNRLIEKSNLRLSSTIDDLTNMQQALTIKSKALQEQKENFESLFNDATLGSLLIQSDRIVDCNNALIEQLGYKEKNDLLFLSLEDFSPASQPSGVSSTKKIIRYLEQCFSEGTVSFEWVVLKKDKTQLWCNVVLTKMSMNNTNVVHAVVSDISDRKALEQEILTHNLALQSTNKELEKSLSDLNVAQRQLIESEKLASLGELVAGVAHEINTPVGIGLTGISHFSSITDDINHKYYNKTMSKSDFEKYLEQSTSVAQLVLRNLQRTAELVSSFKQVSVDQTSEEKRQFEMNEYVNEILISLSNILKHTNLDIKLSCPSSLVIYSYPGAFSQILSNLIINSNIHGYPDKETGIINITIKHTDEQLIIIYQDDGKGISMKSLPKIFDPFYTTNRENGGSGLGLNIIYNIITNQLNGTIRCESEQGQGAKFTISYPVQLIS